MKNQIGYRSLYKTDLFEIGNVYEDAYLINNETKENIHIGWFYGEPTCAFINADNSWCVVGGDVLILIKNFKLIDIDGIKDVFAVKSIDESNIQILTDPWSEYSSIWQLNVESLACIKVQNFTKYKGEKYTNDVDW
ncbi:hypothetical protein CLV62_11854 [Dysgonomonas alginatilytica]|uniref:Uncharacterized protein n=1 Tax=Dysgonomonas alginatilytica TaxID=1605892 RepID=A0A2V3PLF2_9BACT|nr:hypothetical protein [Dysgonomonas alginatilytica]PXV62665.1 hypothetical protein CLV62_11854 [Dysgonomonas alginatilytica]